MQELGRLGDLPANYREPLIRQSLVLLWPNLRAVLPPGKPRPSTRLVFIADETPVHRKLGALEVRD